MKPAAIVVDLDNTIIDTARRKYGVLSAMVGTPVSLQDVRDDYALTKFIGGRGTETSHAFFAQLNSADAIRTHSAGLIEGAEHELSRLADEGIEIVVLTTRSEALRYATEQELARYFRIGPSKTILYEGQPGQEEPDDAAVVAFKRSALETLKKSHQVLAAIGDRPNDVAAAQLAGVTPILLDSTVTAAQKADLLEAIPSLSICTSWAEVSQAIAKASKADGELSDIRKALIAQYSGWLKDIDEKCRLTITIATALLAVAGKQVLDEHNPWSRLFLGVLVLMPSLLSMLYGIRGYTARSTSRGGPAVPIKLRQWFAYLFGHPESWLLLAGDEIAQANEMRGQTLGNQAVAHRSYFAGRYGTENPDVIQNRRLFDLRGANYSKLYGERIASKLLSFAVVTMCAWVMLTVLSVWTDSAPAKQANADEAVAALRESVRWDEGVQEEQRRELQGLAATNERLSGEIQQLRKDLQDLASKRRPAADSATKKGRP